MPYYYDPNLDKDREEQSAASFQLSGAAPVVNSLATNEQKAGKGPQTGSGFQNLDKYLAANQAQQFGQKVTGKVGEQLTGAEGQMQRAGEQFRETVAGANLLPTENQIGEAIKDPTKMDPKQWQEWQKAQYQGPNSLAENQDAWNKYWSGTNRAATSAGMLGSEAGRFTLLDQYFGRPAYSFGEKSLDNLLVQGSGIGAQTRQLQNQAAALQGQGMQGVNQLQNVASARAGEVERSRNAVRGAIGIDEKGQVITGEKLVDGQKPGALGRSWGEVEGAVTAKNLARKGEREALEANLTAGALTPAQLEALGLTAGESLYNVDPRSFYTAGTDLTKDQVMTPEQRAYIRALSEMSGVTDTFAAGEAVNPSANYTFNRDAFRTAVGAKGAEYARRMDETPVVLTNPDGSKATKTMGEIQRDLDNIAKDRARGIESNMSNRYESNARAALDAARAQLATEYQANRKLGVR